MKTLEELALRLTGLPTAVKITEKSIVFNAFEHTISSGKVFLSQIAKEVVDNNNFIVTTKNIGEATVKENYFDDVVQEAKCQRVQYTVKQK